MCVVLFCKRGNAQENHLQQCCEKQAGIKGDQIRVFEYTKQGNSLYHSPKPWMVISRTYTGKVWSNYRTFINADTFYRNEKAYISKEQFKNGELLTQLYWKTAASDEVIAKAVNDIPLTAAVHDPAMLLYLFGQADISADHSIGGYATYTAKVNDALVTLYIDKKSNLLTKVAILEYSELYGDVTDTILYKDYTGYKSYYYPQNVYHKKVNDITDTVSQKLVAVLATAPDILERPEGYKVLPVEKEEYKIISNRISDNLYTLQLTQAESASMLVVFNDFLLLIGSPLNSINGELIIEEAKRLVPEKPIRYFAYGHHHPWYIGGIRPLVHDGVTILTKEENIPYINFLVNTKHSLKPDSQHYRRVQPNFKIFKDSTVITDGKYSVIAYHIGEESEHTTDYTVFYFPKEKILYEDDLVYIRKDKPVTRGSGRQKGLYEAIRSRKLQVDTIIQTWPWGDNYSFKTTIPYSDLEVSVNTE